MSDDDHQADSPECGAERAAAPCPVVGIGASAGGIEAFKGLLAHTPPDAGAAFVLILHLAPDRESILAEIMGHATAMPVVQAEDGMAVEPNRVYVIPPGVGLTIASGHLRVSRNTPNAGRANPIDLFLLSLAESHGAHAACVILSGAGHDGTLGLKAIKEHGGLTVAQSPESATHDSMLRSAISTGLVDFQLPVQEIPAKVVEYLRHVDGIARDEQAQREPSPDQLQRICARVQAVTGHDFTEYKGRTLVRRIQRRMQVHRLARVDDYIDLLHQGRREADLLLKDLLIGVTQFFRDPQAFEALTRDVTPKLVEGKGADEQIRVWVAGCATGEEAYSIAMLLREATDQMTVGPGIQIFASDIDEAALEVARAGRYPALIERDVSPERLERFFVKEDGTFRVRGSLRETCLFAQHNVLRDPPFSRMHLISCRNLLIYLSAKVQERLLPVFHYALQPGGYILLGSSESVGQHTRLFTPVDKKQRIFARREDGVPHLPRFPLGELPSGPTPSLPQKPQQGALPADALGRRAEAVLAKYSPAYVIVNDHFDIVSASRRTGRFLELGPGRPDINILAMAGPDLRLELRAALQKASRTGARVVHADVKVSVDGATQPIDLIVEPIADKGQTCFLVVFRELGPPRDEHEPMPDAGELPSEDDAVARLEAELREAREELQTTTQELETSNEELRSANEELSSVNEELQSANEELQTSKEELQSVNEELQTVNFELNSRVDDLSRANNYLKNLLENIQLPMVFLDNDLHVRNFTPRATELFRLRETDGGRPITEITSVLDYHRLMDDVVEVQRTARTVEREVETPQGRIYSMRVLPYRTVEDVIDGVIMTFTDVTQHRRSEQHQKMLVSELSHRVKNMLATVQAIAAQTTRGAASIEEFTETFTGRIAALSAAHALLTATDWQGAHLHAVLREPLRAYQSDDGERIAISGEDFGLRPRTALTLSLVVNELATNAAKYGALSTAGGRIELSAALTRKEPGQAVALVWRERGGPEIAAEPQTRYGLDLIRRAVGYELDGETKIEYPREGLRCEIVLPYSSDNFQVQAAAADGG